MREEPYEVVRVPDVLEAPEHQGTRTKFWVRIEGRRGRWLLKVPRADTGEHWAEKVAAEIGHLIGVECAQVELARYRESAVLGAEAGNGQGHQGPQEEAPDQLGTISRSFVPDEDELDKDYLLFHGWQVLHFENMGYDPNQKFGQRNHNIRNIARALGKMLAVKGREPVPGSEDALKKLASYVLLDGLIGNTDRHHENWMVALVDDWEQTWIEIMPSFDHASSLGRELGDEKREEILKADGVRRYVNRGKGGIFVNTKRKRAPAPLHLARLLCRWKPGLTVETLDRIHDLFEEEIRRTIGRVPPAFMSDTAKEFASQVIMTSKQELLRRAP